MPCRACPSPSFPRLDSEALEAPGRLVAEAGSGVAIRGQESAGNGHAAPAASLELRWPDTQQEVLGALLAVGGSRGGMGWGAVGYGKESEREGGRLTLGANAMMNTGLYQTDLGWIPC